MKVIFIFLIPFYLFAQSAQYTEYEVKAAYLEKFTLFIDWPETSQKDDENKPFIIGVIGKTPFESILSKMYSQQKIKDKKVNIQHISKLDQITFCNILFVPKSENYHINHILSYTRTKPILTISDYPEFSKNGIQIILFIENEHVYFEINQQALQQSGLYVSSLLLSLSKAINEEEKK